MRAVCEAASDVARKYQDVDRGWTYRIERAWVDILCVAVRNLDALRAAQGKGQADGS
jgi:hypothetical protein